MKGVPIDEQGVCERGRGRRGTRTSGKGGLMGVLSKLVPPSRDTVRRLVVPHGPGPRHSPPSRYLYPRANTPAYFHSSLPPPPCPVAASPLSSHRVPLSHNSPLAGIGARPIPSSSFFPSFRRSRRVWVNRHDEYNTWRRNLLMNITMGLSRPGHRLEGIERERDEG